MKELELSAIKRVLIIVGAMTLVVTLSGLTGCDKIAEAGSDAKEVVKSAVVDNSCCDEVAQIQSQLDLAEDRILQLGSRVVSDQDWDRLTDLVKKRKKKQVYALIAKLRGME